MLTAFRWNVRLPLSPLRHRSTTEMDTFISSKRIAAFTLLGLPLLSKARVSTGTAVLTLVLSAARQVGT